MADPVQLTTTKTDAQKAGGWLRGYTDPVTQERIATAPGELNRLFIMLASNLLILAEVAKGLYSGKTSNPNAILPKVAETRREGRPAFGLKPTLILPPRLRANG